jgi:23S rRNA (adenine2503-C2)-methyltransferase
MTAAAPLPALTDLTRPRLESAMLERGMPAYRARQVFQWLYRRGVSGFPDMTDVPLALRASLASQFRIPTPSVSRRDISEDGTQKFLLELEDGKHIESVFIPDTPNQTFCLSTQVGCAMGCGFCLTATMGLVRHLTPGEIVGQVRVLAGLLGLRDKTFNVVLMGMGEPLHNYDNTMDALRILTDKYGFGMHPKRITLSTVGIVPAIDRLATEDVMPNLAISLHATTEAQRGSLVPINQKYGIADVLDACRRFPLTRRERITFEYVLIDGVNDSPVDAHRLARLLRDLQAKVNLIPLNPAPGIAYNRPADETLDTFGRILADAGLTVSVRKSRGRDIRAACGQLAVEDRKPSPR